MKIKINREYTTLDMVERTKAQMKEFKETYTDADLVRMFREAIGENNNNRLHDEILRCELSAFPGGTAEKDETHYSVDILLEGFRRFTKIHFYINQSAEIDTRVIRTYGEPQKMWDIEEYNLA